MRQIDAVGDGRSKDRSTFFKKRDRNGIGVTLLVTTVNRILEISGSNAGLRGREN